MLQEAVSADRKVGIARSGRPARKEQQEGREGVTQ